MRKLDRRDGVVVAEAVLLIVVGFFAVGLLHSYAGLLRRVQRLERGVPVANPTVRFRLFRRQVNERWLDQYRAWLYGAGFGWQVGVGLATYIMTTGVFLTVAVAILTGQPAAALLICTTFGVARGLTVLLTRRLRSPAALRSFHRRIGRLEAPVRVGTIVVEVGTTTILGAVVWAPAAAVVVALAATTVAVKHLRYRAAGGAVAAP